MAVYSEAYVKADILAFSFLRVKYHCVGRTYVHETLKLIHSKYCVTWLSTMTAINYVCIVKNCQ